MRSLVQVQLEKIHFDVIIFKLKSERRRNFPALILILISYGTRFAIYILLNIVAFMFVYIKKKIYVELIYSIWKICSLVDASSIDAIKGTIFNFFLFGYETVKFLRDGHLDKKFR